MAVDKWVVSDATRDYVDVVATIADINYPRRIAVSQVAGSTQADILNNLRGQLIAFRTAVLAEETASATIQTTIGYTENF